MRENNNRGPLTGRAMALRPIREAAVFLLVLAALLLTPGKRAGADVIWTPDDSFYDQHYEDCDYEGRRYYANGADGYVTVMESPEKRNVLDVLANGPVLYVSMTYDKGMSGKWGLVQYVLNDEGQPAEDYSWDEGATVGWIKMEELLSVYDGYSFAEEHRAEIQERVRLQRWSCRIRGPSISGNIQARRFHTERWNPWRVRYPSIRRTRIRAEIFGAIRAIISAIGIFGLT